MCKFPILIVTIFVSITIIFNNSIYAKAHSNEPTSDWILNPTETELDQMKEVFARTNTPLAIIFVYNRKTHSVVFGIPVSSKIRNGGHARLLVLSGVVNSLEEAKNYEHDYRGGTLFLETEGSTPVLSVHSRNSHSSTINAAESAYVDLNFERVPDLILQELSNKSGVPIDNASSQLNNSVDAYNNEKYHELLDGSDFKDKYDNFTDFFFSEDLIEMTREQVKLANRIVPNEVSEPDTIDRSPMIEKLLKRRLGSLYSDNGGSSCRSIL